MFVAISAVVGELFCFFFRQMAISQLTLSDLMLQVYVGSYVYANTANPLTPHSDTSSARFHARDQKTHHRCLCGCGCGASVLVRLTSEIHHFMMACFNIPLELDLGCHFRDHWCRRRRTCFFEKSQAPNLTFSDPMFHVQIGSTVAAASAPPKSVVARRPLHGRLSRQSCLSTSTDIAYI